MPGLVCRVLVPGGRIGVSDVVAEGHLNAADRAAAGSTFTHEAASGLHSAIIRAVKLSGT